MARLRALRDLASTMDLASITRMLARGAQGARDAARDEARRVLDVLVERGDLTPEEAEAIEAGVGEAAETHGRWIEEHVLAPLGRALRGAGGAASVDARLAAIEERLARIEAALARRGEGA